MTHGPSARLTCRRRVRRKLRPHTLPDDELLTAPVPLDPSAPDSTVAVHADGGVALSIERDLDKLGLRHDLHHPFLVGLDGNALLRSVGYRQ